MRKRVQINVDGTQHSSPRGSLEIKFTVPLTCVEISSLTPTVSQLGINVYICLSWLIQKPSKESLSTLYPLSYVNSSFIQRRRPPSTTPLSIPAFQPKLGQNLKGFIFNVSGCALHATAKYISNGLGGGLNLTSSIPISH